MSASCREFGLRARLLSQFDNDNEITVEEMRVFYVNGCLTNNTPAPTPKHDRSGEEAASRQHPLPQRVITPDRRRSLPPNHGRSQSFGEQSCRELRSGRTMPASGNHTPNGRSAQASTREQPISPNLG
ncbi:hypothetical protein TWF788_007647 [Orbilia oligospora]|uniref:Uncharacterized protein n=1 Tax=Orbilia oligospora TaxID=2813651 RepID=A0A7C8PSD3_ORBOL|nr:hypothetical protein TWF788_007647 [Orbilia oligospora]